MDNESSLAVVVEAFVRVPVVVLVVFGVFFSAAFVAEAPPAAVFFGVAATTCGPLFNG